MVITETPSVEFESALDWLLPDDDEVAHFVHKTLAEPTRCPKRNVIVFHRGEPVLATTLRARQDRWEIATTAVAPTLRIPHRNGFLEPALSALGLRILIQDYFGDAQADFKRQHLKPFDSYVAQLNGFDFDAYWRSTGALPNIRRARKRTIEISVVHDDPATMNWCIDTWETRWAGNPSDEAGAADDQRSVWPHLLKRGTLTTTALVSPGGTPVAANVCLIDGDTMIGLTSARDLSSPAVGSSVGTLALIECWDHARAAGLAKVDAGSYDDYKRRLMVPGRTAYEVEIAPRIIASRTVTRARHTAGKVKRRLQRLASSPVRTSPN